jgi:plastocyanin
MPTGPSWLFVALKMTGRDANYINEMLHSKTLGISARKEKRRIVSGIREILAGAVGNTHDANMWVGVTANSGSSGAYPAGNIACTQANAAGDTVTFTWGGQTVVLTEGSTSTTNGFARGASNTTLALALATTINAHPVLGGLYTAVPSVGNCALTGKIPGAILQDIAISTNDATAFTLTQLTGGAEFTAAMMLQHIWLGRNP